MAYPPSYRLLVLPTLAAGLALVACQSTDAGPGGSTAAADIEPVIDALRRGKVERARELLDDVLVTMHLEEAQTQFAAGKPELGLLAIDKALKLAPDATEVRIAKADGSLQLAEQGIGRGATATLIEGSLGDAFDFYSSVDTPEALLGASRAALLLGNTDDAVTYARRADVALGETAEPKGLTRLPERVLAEATFRAYTDLRLSEGSVATDTTTEEDATDAAAPALSPERVAVFDETNDALARLLARTGDDPWAFGQLGDLYEWEERFDESEAVLRRGLARNPESAELYDRLARVSRKNGGGEHTIEVFDSLIAADASLALPHWYVGLERFDIATADLMDRFPTEENPDAPEAAPELVAAFETAEADFTHCREIEPSFDVACRGYEVMCRNARGWYHYQLGDYEDAVAAFLATNDVMPRGIEWSIEGRLLAGTSGLHLIGTGYNDREDWESAGDVYRTLEGLQPDNSVWANNAGFFYRDAGVALETIGKRLCRAAEGDMGNEQTLALLREAADVPEPLYDTADEKSHFREAANSMLEKARALVAESAASYANAARLAPEDVRIVNDTALVLVYYTHTDLEKAEQLLLECIELGTRQLEDESLEEDARWELLNAWGDAYQNLGVMYATHRGDLKAAEPLFEKSAEIGPEPRPLITNYWLPLVRGELSSDQNSELFALQSWGQPCAANGTR